MDAFDKMLDAFDAHGAALRNYRVTKNLAERYALDPLVKKDTVSVEEREKNLEAAKVEAQAAFDAYVLGLLNPRDS